MALPIVIITLVLVLLMIAPWLSFPMLLIVPNIKASAEFYVPFFERVDLTVLTCGLAAVAAVWNTIRRVRGAAPLAVPWGPLAALLVLGGVLALGLLWTSAPSYGLRKTYRFLGIGIPYLLLPAFLVRSPRHGRRALLTVAWIGAITAIAVLVVPRSYLDVLNRGRAEIRTTILGSSPIMLAVACGLGAVAWLSAFIVGGSVSRAVRYSALVTLPLALIAILKTGTRSAVVGLLAASALLPWMAGRFGRGKGLLVLIVVIPLCAVGGFWFIQQSAVQTANRWQGTAQARSAAELGGTRLDHYAFCLTHAWNRPLLGHGPGSFAFDSSGWDEPEYPHNVLLEALYEAGTVGAVALALFFWTTLRTGVCGLRITATPQDRLLVIGPLALFVMMAIQSMIHWDLDGVRLLYLFAGLLHANVAQVATTVGAARVDRIAQRQPSRRRVHPAPPAPTSSGAASRH